MYRNLLLSSTRICFAADGAGSGGAAADGSAAGAAAAGAGAAASAAPAAGAAAGSAAAGGASAGGASAVDWIGALPEDDRTFINTKGYKSPGDLIKAYRNAESLIGLEKLAIPKEDSSPEAWDEFHRKLGRPDKADGYGFKAPQGMQGYDAKTAQWFGELSHKAGLNVKQANMVHDAFMELVQAGGTQDAKVIEQRHEANYASLRSEWGVAAPAKIEAANKAIRHFGGDSVIAKLKAAGLNSDPELNKMFAKIGEAMEDDSIGGTGGGGAGFSLTPDDAKAEIAKMEGDSKGPLYDKYHPEHALAIKRRNDLYAMAYPDQNQKK